MALPARLAFRVQLALQEAASNAVLHGFAPGGSGEVWLEIAAGADRVEAVLRDNGVAFDPVSAALPPVPRSIEELPPDGRGLAVMRRFCRQMRYRRAGATNELVMVFEAGEDAMEAGSSAGL